MYCSKNHAFFFSSLIIIFFIGLLLPIEAYADKESDSKQLYDLQKELETSDYHQFIDSNTQKNYQLFKETIDDYIVKHDPDKQYVRSIIYYAKFISTSDSQKAIDIYHQTKLICDEQHYDTLKAFISHDLASVYFQKGLLSEAYPLFIQSAEYFKIIGDDPAYGYALIDVGNVYYRKGQLDMAEQYYLQAIPVFRNVLKNSDQSYGLALLYDNLGQVLTHKKEFDSSLIYFMKAFDIRKHDSLSRKYYSSFLLIAEMYLFKGDLDSSIYYNKRAIAVCKELGQQSELAFSYYSYANTLFAIDTVKALHYMYKSIALAEDNDLSFIMRAYDFLGKYYFKQNIDSALTYSELLYGYALRENHKNYLRNSVYRLVGLYHRIGLEHQEAKYLRIQVQQLMDDNANELYKIELKNEVQKWNRERAIYQEKREYDEMIGNFKTAIAALVLIFSFILIRGHFKLKRVANQLEKSNEKLQESNRNKDAIYSVVAHDLRGPVGASLGLIKLMDEAYIEGQTLSEVVPIIRKSMQGTYNLLDNLLSWAQLNKNEIKIDIKKTNLRNTVSEVIRILEESAHSKSIEVSNLIIQDMNVFADKASISTVLRNLISNSIKFTNKGGLINIQAEEQSKYIQIAVHDNGRGMDEDTLKKIFSDDIIFTNPGTDDEKGSGLGLKLCKECVAMNKGKIWVDSKEGEGSVFYFTLPKA